MRTDALSLRRRTLLGSGLVLAMLPLPAFGQSPLAPGSEVAAIHALLDPASGPTGRADFHAEMLSAAGQRWLPLAQFELFFDKVAALSGGLYFVAAVEQGNTLWLSLRSQRQGALRTLRVRMPARSLTIFRCCSPGSRKADRVSFV